MMLRQFGRNRLKIISYNLRKNRAVTELQVLDSHHDVDVLCLQEAETVSLPERVNDLRLVHATSQNRLGLAMYVRDDRFQVEEARTFELKKSLHDRVLSPAHERLLGARMYDHEYGQEVVFASFHAAPLTALNSLRRHQISTALERLDILGPGLPSLMVGDYNYPVFQNRLITEMRTRGYDTTISDLRTYQRYGVFRGHYDFATSKSFDVHGVRTLPQGTSDHLPILVSAIPAQVPVTV